MAAAYLFHIVSNHPFVDGNKRAGLLAAQVFLDLNGVTLDYDSEAFYDLTMWLRVKSTSPPSLRRSIGSRNQGRLRGTSWAGAAEGMPKALRKPASRSKILSRL